MAFLSLKAAPGSCTGQAVSSAAPSSAPTANPAAGTPLPTQPTCPGLPPQAPQDTRPCCLGWLSSLRQPWLLARCRVTLIN